ncbi:MAG: efflux RND transporter periplasmic adaptor subunit [Gemmatimonadetes bacterium]|nr:MAG: efflux RND transporter periplasmic adaptor subunit [Gemmatimonadota bacterium]
MNIFKSSLILIALSCLSLILGSCDKPSNAQEQGNEAADSQQNGRRLTNVKVITVEAKPFTNYMNFVGTVKPNKSVTVSAEEGGRLLKLYVDKGDRVRAGDTLAQIEDDILKATYNLNRAQYDLAMVNYNSAKQLYENNGGISETEYVTAKFNAEMAEAQKDIAKKRLENTTILSPMAGVITQTFVEEGELVGPGTPIVSLMDVSTVKIEVGIPETEILFFKTGTSATITFDAIPGETFTGTIRYISPTVDPRNRTFEAEVVVKNPGNLIKAEMVAKLRMVKKVYETAVTIPQDALIETETGKAVYILENGNIARFRNVETGPTHNGDIMIREGLRAGEKLIVVGQRSVADGEPVRVLD